MSTNVFSMFGLTFKQTCLLFSMERQIVVNDITYSETQNKVDDAKLKKEWLNNWDLQINAYLKELESNDYQLTSGIESVDAQKLYNSIKDESNNLTWKYLILLETVLFNPYFPLKEIEDKGFWNKIKENFNQLSLKKDSRTFSLNNIARILEIDLSYIDKFQKRYDASLNKISGKWSKIAIGIGTGVIVTTSVILFFINPIAGSMAAAKGLSGIAAFNAGMAALGGGAIAAGGFGVVGGITVLVGGAMVLGGTTGALIGAIASNPKIMMTEIAKIEVVLKEIVLGVQKDTKLFQEILHQLINNENEMKMEIERLKVDVESNKEKIKNLEEAVKYLERGIDELRK